MEPCPVCLEKVQEYKHYLELIDNLIGTDPRYRFLRRRITEAINFWTERSVAPHGHAC